MPIMPQTSSGSLPRVVGSQMIESAKRRILGVGQNCVTSTPLIFLTCKHLTSTYFFLGRIPLGSFGAPGRELFSAISLSISFCLSV